MITKAIVEQIIDDNSVKIRIPILDKVSSSSLGTEISSCQIAHECTIPNFRYNFNVGDIVFIDFEENNIDSPVIIGYLYGVDNSYPSGEASSISIENSSVLPEQTKIGNIEPSEIKCLENTKSNIQQDINSIKSNDVADRIHLNEKGVASEETSIGEVSNECSSIYEESSELNSFITNKNSDLFRTLTSVNKNLSKVLSKIGNNGSSSISDLLDDLEERLENLEETFSSGYEVVPSENSDIIENPNSPYSSLYECIMYDSYGYKNAVYKDMVPVGILWHDTSAGNPNLKRYVQPSKSDRNYHTLINLLGKNESSNDWNTLGIINPYHKASVNAWIGKLANRSVATMQTLPWSWSSNGCGSGSKGSCNNGWIQFEMCDDGYRNASYFKKVYNEAVKLTAYLCNKFNINPHGYVKRNGVNVPTILCHYDSCLLGFGSNHGDVYGWFEKFGKTMDDVRNDVALLMASMNSPSVDTKQWISKLGRKEQYLTEAEMKNNAEVFYYWAKTKGWSLASIAGILGCCEAESNINPSCKNYKEMDTHNNENYGIGLTQWTNTPLATATSGRHTDMVNWVSKNYLTWTSGVGQSEFLLNDLYARKTTCSISQLTSMIPSELQHKNGKSFALCHDNRWTAEMAAAWFLGCYTAGYGDKKSQSYYDAHWDVWFSSRKKFANKWYNYLNNL